VQFIEKVHHLGGEPHLAAEDKPASSSYGHRSNFLSRPILFYYSYLKSETSSGHLPFATEHFSIQIVHRVVSVTRILKLLFPRQQKTTQTYYCTQYFVYDYATYILHWHNRNIFSKFFITTTPYVVLSWSN